MKNFITLLFFSVTIGLIQCCEDNNDCSISNTSCDSGECVCNLGYVSNSDGSKCLPYATEYNAECTEDVQCEWLGDNSECNTVCRCKEGYRWYLGKCSKYVGLGETCSADIDCFDGYNLQSLICQDNKCSCNNGYYQRGDTDCRKISSELNGICTLDMDCQVPNTTTECILGKCQSPSKSLHYELTTIEETNFASGVVNEKKCSNNDDCNIENSICYSKTGTCICEPKYFFNSNGTACIAELGINVNCTTDSDCLIKPGKCDNGVCYCRDYYFVGNGNRNCIKSMSETNWNCLSKEWCYALGSYVYCSSNETCSCSKISDYDEKNHICVWNGETDSDLCKSDLECSTIKNSFCINERCVCKENYIQTNNACIPEVGQPCDINDDMPCITDNAECRDGICQCTTNSIASNKTCYQKKDKLGDECEVPLQCSSNILYAECIENKCQCDDNYLAFENKCYQKTEYGSYCNNRIECILSLPESLKDTVQCRKSQCLCPTGYTFEDNKCSSASFLNGNWILITIFLLKSVFSVS